MISTCRRSRFIPIAHFVGVLRGSSSLIGRLRVVTDGRDGQMVLSSACTEKYASPYLWLNLTLQFSWRIVEVSGFRQALSPRADVSRLYVDIIGPHQTYSIYSGLASSNFVEAAETIPSRSPFYQCVVISSYFALIL